MKTEIRKIFFPILMGIAFNMVCACSSDDDERMENPVEQEEENPIHEDGEYPVIDVALLCPDGNHPHAIDLGTGVKWACCNVGAIKPDDYGQYFAWGEVETQENFGWSKYKWGYDYSLKKYTLTENADNKTTLEAEDDAAYMAWGGKWHMPDKRDIEELITSCVWQVVTANGINGSLVTGLNGNSIFLPAAGGKNGYRVYHLGSRGEYWSRTLAETSPSISGYNGDSAYDLSFYNTNEQCFRIAYRMYGRTVRPVSE